MMIFSHQRELMAPKDGAVTPGGRCLIPPSTVKRLKVTTKSSWQLARLRLTQVAHLAPGVGQQCDSTT
jgi:hypothetical protein